MAIGHELRPRIVQAVQTHQVSQARLAQMRGVSVSSIKRIGQRGCQTGSSQLRSHAGGKRPKLTDEQWEPMRQYVRADTDVTWREGQRWLETTHAIQLSLPALSRLLTKLHWPRKNHCTRRNATQRRISKSGPPGAGR